MFTYFPKGVCSSRYDIEIEDNKIVSIAIQNGCRGNLQGISSLLKGMDIDDVIARMEGIRCRGNTSCPDQISKALRAYKEQQA